MGPGNGEGEGVNGQSDVGIIVAVGHIGKNAGSGVKNGVVMAMIFVGFGVNFIGLADVDELVWVGGTTVVVCVDTVSARWQPTIPSKTIPRPTQRQIFVNGMFCILVRPFQEPPTANRPTSTGLTGSETSRIIKPFSQSRRYARPFILTMSLK